MLRKILATAILAGLALEANASLTTGDIAFTSFNSDEDGLSIVNFVDIAANTIIYFSDNEYVSGAFNTGESFNQWNSGAATIAAGTVIRFSAYDKTTLSASFGTLSRVAVSGSSNWGIANSNETIYAYLGSAATSPNTFLAAITNSDFVTAADGTLSGTGLTAGVNAIRLNLNNPSTTPDFGEYTGVRSGAVNFDAYKALVANIANWTVDTSNGAYAATVPNTTNFTVAAVPVPAAVWLFGSALAGLGVINRRKNQI
jgi:hypothetical protein